MSERRQRRRRRYAGRGLSLLEVLVAMTVLAIGIVGALSALSSSVQAHRAAEEYTRAVTMAQQAIAEIRHQPSLTAGTLSGSLEDFAPGYRWEAEIGEGTADGLLPVQVTILWGERSPRHYQMQTYLRAPAAESDAGTTPTAAGGSQ
ncbi:MAG: type IV pilus modification PilV family protein [Armatimonadota bacterium]